MVPSLNDVQSVPWPEASVRPLIGRPYTPPSLPTHTYGVPLRVPNAMECWSGCVVRLQPATVVAVFGTVGFQHEK